jgi:hypothetical protein
MRGVAKNMCYTFDEILVIGSRRRIDRYCHRMILVAAMP